MKKLTKKQQYELVNFLDDFVYLCKQYGFEIYDNDMKLPNSRVEFNLRFRAWKDGDIVDLTNVFLSLGDKTLDWVKISSVK